MFAQSQWVFEAEGSSMSHAIGRADGSGWSANTNDDSEHHMCYGPYTTAISGPNRAAFRLMIDNNTSDDGKVVYLDVFDATAGKTLSGRYIYRMDFLATFTYQDFYLDFVSTSGHSLEFRTMWFDIAYINEDKVTVTAQTFEAEGASMSHVIGRADGSGWSANTTSDSAGHMCYGPYTTAFAGANCATFKLMIDNHTATNDTVVYLDVYDYDSNTLLANRTIYRNDFLADYTYQDFDLGFNATSGHRIEFRTLWYDKAYINQDSVVLNSNQVPTIYKLDLRSSWELDKTAWYDIQHTAVCVQGLANRGAPRVFLDFIDTDDQWFEELTASEGLCQGWAVQYVSDIYELLNLMRPYINGLVLYDAVTSSSGIISTSLAATTAAGVEGAIAVRKDTTSGSMYDYLVNTMHLPVLIDLTGKFTGSGTIWGTSTASSGSAKCDAYIWAKEKYIDSARCNPKVLSYTLDAWALKTALEYDVHSQLANLDYAISKKGFCFELSPWGDEKPNDDTSQTLGTDLNTFKSILAACNTQTANSSMIKICGFPNWPYKYTSNVGGSHSTVATEWEFVNICSAYNVYTEADAPSPNNISNASFYAALLPEFNGRRYVQNPAPTYDDMVSRGLITSGGSVPNGNYILMGLGDYDQASWVLYQLANSGGYFNDDAKNSVYCSWGLDPNAVDRVCVAVDYMYRNMTEHDFFVGWDSGAGYVNPIKLYGTRSPSGYSSAINMWQQHCKNYYRTLDYSITAWMFPCSSSNVLTSTDYSNYAPFSGDGVGASNVSSSVSDTVIVSSVPCKKVNILCNTDKAVNLINYSSGVHFGLYQTSVWTPTQLQTKQNAYTSNNHQFLDAYSFFYLLKYYLGGSNYYRATWVNDTIPRIMAAGTSYSVTVTVRNEGWDTWTNSTAYRLGHAIVASGATPAYSDYDSRGRVTIPGSGSVAPGDTVTFSFTITAPSTTGYYDLYYDMVRDGITWFRNYNNIEWKMPIIVASSETDVDTDRDGVPDVTEDANGKLYWNPDDGATPLTDTAPPTGSVTINSGASYTGSTSVTLTIAAADRGSGAAYMSLANAGSSWGAWQTRTSSKSWVLMSGDGTKTVWIQFKDVSGNLSNAYSDTIILDQTAPVPGTATPPSSATGTISVPYSGASDSSSGLNKVELWYKYGSGGTWANSGLALSTASGTFTFTPSNGSGSYYFDLVAQDNVGNRSAAASGSGDGYTTF